MGSSCEMVKCNIPVMFKITRKVKITHVLYVIKYLLIEPLNDHRNQKTTKYWNKFPMRRNIHCARIICVNICMENWLNVEVALLMKTMTDSASEINLNNQYTLMPGVGDPRICDIWLMYSVLAMPPRLWIHIVDIYIAFDEILGQTKH